MGGEVRAHRLGFFEHILAKEGERDEVVVDKRAHSTTRVDGFDFSYDDAVGCSSFDFEVCGVDVEARSAFMGLDVLAVHLVDGLESDCVGVFIGAIFDVEDNGVAIGAGGWGDVN